ncbi:MAG TPA: SDR family NAD(P)-dependent oxidoreductase [Acidocella sp.]|nr:SDR family NAD(P)-dependent oxidoreductase [Acidocella sp.]
MSKPVCVVVGIGPGNGAALARRFAAGGYAVALLARSGGLSAALAAELKDARAYECDVAEAASVKDTFALIRAELGEVDVLVYNAGSGSWGSVEEITPEAFEAVWRVNALGALLTAQEVIPAMKRKGAGSIIFIGATASLRGMPRTAAFAPAKAAQRILAESMARTLWPAGIHVAILVLDGMVDLERTRQMMPGKGDEFFIKPGDVAENAFWLSRQARSAWSFAIEARPFGEAW